jgi:hypothetical protein
MCIHLLPSFTHPYFGIILQYFQWIQDFTQASCTIAPKFFIVSFSGFKETEGIFVATIALHKSTLQGFRSSHIKKVATLQNLCLVKFCRRYILLFLNLAVCRSLFLLVSTSVLLFFSPFTESFLRDDVVGRFILL